VNTVILRLNEGDATVNTALDRLKDANGGAQVITVKSGIKQARHHEEG
jgi:hypothetical protein